MASCKLTIGGTTFTVIDDNGTTSSNTQDVSGYKVSCQSLTYEKKVYEPCKIVARMQLTYTSDSPTPETLHDLFSGKAVELKVGDNEVAENYYVHEIVPKYKPIKAKDTSKSLYIDLYIYSNDKKLTLDKYCKAYTGRRLVEEILKKNIRLVNEKWEEKGMDTTVPDLLREASVTIAPDAQLQFLSYKKTIMTPMFTNSSNHTLCNTMRVSTISLPEPLIGVVSSCSSRMECYTLAYQRNKIK